MRSAKLAEWILARWTTREHAAAIVGDLLEAAPGTLWSSVARTVVGIAWRAGAPWLLAVATLCAVVEPVVRSEAPPHGIGPTGVLFKGIGMCVAAVFGYSVARYGIADRLTQLAAAVTLACVAGVCFRWVPGVVPACVVVGVGAVLAAVLSSDGRRATVGLVSAVVASSASWKVIYWVMPRRLELLPQWEMNLLSIGTLALISWAPVWAAVRVRRFAARHEKSIISHE